MANAHHRIEIKAVANPTSPQKWTEMHSLRGIAGPLHRALIDHQPQVLVDRIKNQRDRDYTVTDPSGRNLLQLAAGKGFIEAMLWLIYSGVPIDLAKPGSPSPTLHPSQRTPLYQAMLNNQYMAAQLLVICHADKQIAMAQATKEGRYDIVNALKNLEIDPAIYDSLLFWTIKHYHSTFQNRLLEMILNNPATVQPKRTLANLRAATASAALEAKTSTKMGLMAREDEEEYDEAPSLVLHSLLELTTKLRNKTAFDLLIAFNKEGSFRTSPFHATFGFWAAIWDEEAHPLEKLFKLINKDNAHVIRALAEIGSNTEVFPAYYADLKDDQQTLFLDTPSWDHHKDRGFTPAQGKIFEAAAYGFEPMLKAFLKKSDDITESANVDSKADPSEKEDTIPLLAAEKKSSPTFEELNKDFFIVLEVMVRERNFIATTNLIKLLGEENVFAYALKKQNRNLFIFVMFSSNQFPYERGIKMPDQLKEMLSLYPPKEAQGLLFRCIDHSSVSIIKDLRFKQDISLQKALFELFKMDRNQLFSLLCQIVFGEYGDMSIEETRQHLSSSNKTFICRFAERLRIEIDLAVPSKIRDNNSEADSFFFANKFFTDTQGALKKTLEWLNPTELASLSRTARRFVPLCSNSQRLVINLFLEKLRHEINQKSYFAYRCPDISSSEKIYLILGLLFLTWLTVAASRLGIHDANQAVIRRELHWTQDADGKWCDRFIPYDDNNKCGNVFRGGYPPPDSKCYDPCIRLERGRPLMIELGWEVTLSSLLLLTAFLSLTRISDWSLPDRLRRGLFAGNARFNDAKITEFSLNLQSDYHQLRGMLAHRPDFNLTPESTLNDIKLTLQEIQNELKATEQSLLEEKQANEKSLQSLPTTAGPGPAHR